MKNTVKKILALVFAVVMVCSLAVPALAAEKTYVVGVKVVGLDGVAQSFDVTLKEKDMNVEKALKDTAVATRVTVNTSSGKVTALDGNKVTSKEIVGEFGTGSVVVAVNGKAVSEDLATVSLEKGDLITVYWADSTLGTKLALVDDSRLAEGIVSLFYYDAEGNKQPLVGAKFVLTDDATGSKLVDAKGVNATTGYPTGSSYFTTDEKGQIWLRPSYLDKGASYTLGYYLTNTIVEELDEIDLEDENYSAEEKAYYNTNLNRNVEEAEVIGYVITVDADMYVTADATGDMTMVYVLVAAAAMVTLAAVVVMKKKAVKAN